MTLNGEFFARTLGVAWLGGTENFSLEKNARATDGNARRAEPTDENARRADENDGAESEFFCGNAPGKIRGAAIDSRKILPDEIFVAIKTANRDGHDFLGAALARGAAGALVTHFVPEFAALPQLVVPDTVVALQKVAAAHREKNCRGRVTIFGVTGSVGKTSTKDLLAAILSRTASTLATAGNLNNTLGVPMTLLRIDASEHRFAVVEAGMSVPGEMRALAAMIQPDVALVTNVRAAHLEGLGTLENIAREKSALAAAVPPGGEAFFYSELLHYEAFRALAPEIAVPVEKPTLRERADGFEFSFGAFDGAASHAGSIAISALAGEKFFVKNASRGLAENAALAVLAVRKFVSVETIRRALETRSPSANRGEIRSRRSEKSGATDGNGEGGEAWKIFVDCYNASPSSMADSAEFFSRRFPGGVGTPRLFVLGGMGELGAESAALHFGVGEKLPLCAATDFLALFGGNAPQIGEGAASRGFPRERIRVFEKIEALREFVAAFRGNVMVKGSRAFALERAVPED